MGSEAGQHVVGHAHVPGHPLGVGAGLTGREDRALQGELDSRRGGRGGNDSAGEGTGLHRRGLRRGKVLDKAARGGCVFWGPAFQILRLLFIVVRGINTPIRLRHLPGHGPC